MSCAMVFFQKVIAGFILTLLMEISHTEGMCRHLAIKKVLPRKVLVNHTVKRIQPIDQRALCSSKCYLEQSCFSYNFCHEESLCELLDSDHLRHGEHLVEKAGCTFYGSETSCSSNPCAKNATCQGDLSGEKKLYRCVCPRGFTGQNCEIEIDECLTGNNVCHANAMCSNVIGGYNCTCKKGFYGDGMQCNDEDECTDGTHDCHANATCSNVIGGYNCTCKEGFYGDGMQCIDECINVTGGPDCMCENALIGDSSFCASAPLGITRGLAARRVGCFKDTGNRAIPTLEGQSNLLTGRYQSRSDAIKKCALAAARRGWCVFAVQNQGWCASSPTAGSTYNKYGPHNTCRNGKGGPWGNDAYVLEGNAAKKTTTGYICVFPFTYKGKTYDSCTNVDRNRPWCAITPNYDVDKLWGNCCQ